jgi:hypothetical protein
VPGRKLPPVSPIQSSRRQQAAVDHVFILMQMDGATGPGMEGARSVL